MGKRHQAFLIAQVIPHGGTEAKYRCIAALHHQWCYGTLPLRAASRLIRLLKQPLNAMILREEINTLNGKYGRWRDTDKPQLPHTPAPYALFLLQSAFGTNMDGEDVLASAAICLDANMGSFEGDNNDGIAVIDVTKPEDPHYCFIQFTHIRPLSANGYVRGYYPISPQPTIYARDADRPQIPGEGTTPERSEPEFHKGIDDLVAQFSDVKLVNYDMLAEAWPDEYGGSRESGVMSASLPSLKKVNDQALPPVPSLVHVSLKPAIVSAIEGDQLDALDHYLLNPAIVQALREILLGDPSLQSKSVPLLSKVVAMELNSNPAIMIDLSNFTLTSEQIIELLTAHQNLSSLNLSHNSNVTLETLKQLLTDLPSLRRLILFDTSISRDDLITLLQSQPSLFYKLSVLIHPAFLDRMDEELAWASDYGHFTPDRSEYSISTRHCVGVTLPFFSPTLVVQSIISVLAAARRPSGHQTFYSIDYLDTFFQAAYATEYVEKRHSWGDRCVPICPQSFRYPLVFRLRGWLFIWEKPQINVNKYAWIRFNSEAVEKCEAGRGIEDRVQKGAAVIEALGEKLFDIYDLQGFLDACVAEGRPAVPDDLKKTALECMTKWKTADPKASVPLSYQLMTSANEVLELFKKELKNEYHWE